jgi:YidC/Oxa1 family membrane protein insertase
MQERRALIAIVLIFLVYVIFTTVFRPQRKPASEPEDAQPREVVEEVDQTQVRPAAAGAGETDLGLPAVVPAVEAPLTETEVITPLYTCRFSSVGGVLTSFRLHDYPLNDFEPVELVPESEILPFAVALLLKTGDRIDLSRTNWKVSSQALRIEETSEASLGFELLTESGLIVRKSCHFKGDTYVMDVDVSVTGPGSDAVRAVEFGWQSGLRVTEIHRESDDLRSFAGVTLSGGDIEKVDRGDVKKRERIEFAGDIQWSGLRTKYFLAAVLPEEGSQTVVGFFHPGGEAIGMALETAGTGTHRYIV